MIKIRFENSTESPFYLQIDPWAGLYLLRGGESIEIEARSDAGSPSVEIDECGEVKILTLPDSDEYFVVNKLSENPLYRP